MLIRRSRTPARARPAPSESPAGDPRVASAPDDWWYSSRRKFLGRFAGVAAGATALGPLSVEALATPTLRAPGVADLPEQGQATDESYWRAVRDLFPLRDGLIVVNAANLCPSSYPVMEAELTYVRDVNRDPSLQNRGKFSGLREEAREMLAAYVGADPEEIAIVHNTTAGNNQVVWGLDYQPGDEIVVWSQNHPTNNIAWDIVAQRYGLVVHKVDTPPDPADPRDLIGPFLEAMGPRTRMLALTHVSNVSGVLLPAAELCALARERGVITLVDGVQTFGALNLDLHAMGCDFYTASTHKWLTGPRQNGILYVRRERVRDLWPSIVGVGYGPQVEESARKFETLGQRNDATLSAIAPALEMHQRIGPERVERRVRALASASRRALSERVPGVRFHTPADPRMAGGVLVFAVPGTDHGELYNRLYGEAGVACARMSGTFDGVRFSPHIYNTLDQVERAAAAVAELTRGGLRSPTGVEA
ncbi:aminotransferase class V-fold PLP-dependent enzyme [Gemmatimonadota bacterium]